MTHERDLDWLKALPEGCLGSLELTTYACKDSIIHNGFAESCMFIFKDEPWCYLGWDGSLLKHQLVNISILYKEAIWEVLVRPYPGSYNTVPYQFISSAIVSLDNINIIMR